MNIQEREELDYNPQPALQLLFAESSVQFERRDPKINEALDRGKYVVVGAQICFCHSTDACLGEREHYESEYDTLDQANAELDHWQDGDEGSFEDIRFYVLSPKGTIVTIPDPPDILF